MNCKRTVVCICCLLMCKAAAFSLEPVVREDNPGNRHYFEMFNNNLVKEGFVTVDEESFPAVFILDTGAPTSGYYCAKGSRAYEKIRTSGGIITAGFDDVRIDNLEINNFLSFLGRNFTKKYSSDIVKVILGVDVLIHKSFYISITDKYFYWGENLRSAEDAVVKKLEQFFLEGVKLWRYAVYDDDEHFLSSADSRFKDDYLSEDGKQSKYLIDTGSYFASTGAKDYYEIVDKHGYDNIVDFYSYPSSRGSSICKVENHKFLGRKFDKVYYSTGLVIPPLKLYGTQVLGAFDIYFDCNENGIAETALFYPVEEEKYKAFVEKQDIINLASHSFLYGFHANIENIVDSKSYLNGKELVKKIEIGDEILEQKEFENHAEFKIKKQNGKIKKVKAKKIVL